VYVTRVHDELHSMMTVQYMLTQIFQQRAGSLCIYVHCGENSRISRDAADQTLPVTEFSEIYTVTEK
jgi:hypothetical protein